MVSQSRARAAARTAAAMLAVGAGFMFYWSLGGTWAFGGQTPSEYAGWDQSETAVIGGWCLVFAGVLLVRVGYWHEHVPSWVAGFADSNAWLWLVVILGLVSAVQAFVKADLFYGTFFLILAALAFVVVRSERPVSPTSRAAPTPSGKPGPPTSAH